MLPSTHDFTLIAALFDAIKRNKNEKMLPLPEICWWEFFGDYVIKNGSEMEPLHALHISHVFFIGNLNSTIKKVFGSNFGIVSNRSMCIISLCGKLNELQCWPHVYIFIEVMGLSLTFWNPDRKCLARKSDIIIFIGRHTNINLSNCGYSILYRSSIDEIAPCKKLFPLTENDMMKWYQDLGIFVHLNHKIHEGSFQWI